MRRQQRAHNGKAMALRKTYREMNFTELIRRHYRFRIISLFSCIFKINQSM